MRLKQIVSVLALLTISGCSLLQQAPREVEIITKPVKIDIVQPVMPRAIDLKEPKWYVVSDTKIIENCLKDPETKKSNCKLGREDLYPEGYTYLDRFIDDIKKKTETLVQASMKLGEAIYKSQEKKPGTSKDSDKNDEGKKDDNVVDADFEEVKDVKEEEKDKEKSA